MLAHLWSTPAVGTFLVSIFSFYERAVEFLTLSIYNNEVPFKFSHNQGVFCITKLRDGKNNFEYRNCESPQIRDRFEPNMLWLKSILQVNFYGDRTKMTFKLWNSLFISWNFTKTKYRESTNIADFEANRSYIIWKTLLFWD